MTSLGKYELHEQLGRGGFGTVFRATDTSLSRVVALKILHPQLTTEPDFLDRFRNEARLVASLRSSNIVTIFELSEQDGRIFIAMDYQAGGSLKELIDTHGPITLEDSIRIIQQVGKGLTKAHARGLIHRDIKPANILFDEDGNAVIGDFGLAHTLVKTSSMPATGTSMVGTPAYMAPELWRGKPASPASDIYSLGCILYEMLTGEVLFAGDTPADVMTKHVLEGPQLTGELPASVLPVLEKSLVKDPQDRFHDIQAFVSALEEALPRPNVVDLSIPPSEPQNETEIIVDSAVKTEQKIKGEKTTELMGSDLEIAENGENQTIDLSQERVNLKKSKPNYIKWLGLAAFVIIISSLIIWGIWKDPRRALNPSITDQVLPTLTLDLPATQASISLSSTQTAIANEYDFSDLKSHSILVYGPVNDSLKHKVTGETELNCFDNSGSPLSNFVTEVVFVNPYSAETNKWDYGFVFVDNEKNQEYRLTIHSDSYWDLTHRTNDVVTEIVSGELVNLKLNENEQNLIKLTSIDSSGYLFINDEFIIRLSLATNEMIGKLCLATGIFKDDVVDGELTNYKEWHIWQVDQSIMVSPIDGMVMVYVPKGEFLMGSASSVGEDYEQPQRTVYLDGYWIDRTEVTNAMYAECILAGGCTEPQNQTSFSRESYFGDPIYADFPVINVDWFQAQDYCLWAERTLPTEAQWEKAARGLEGLIYPWGDEFVCSNGNFDDESQMNDYTVEGGLNCDGYSDTAPVESFPVGASQYGALNMAGNVWEWVADWSYKYPLKSERNPIGPDSGYYRIMRGGSWNNSEYYIRAAYRGKAYPEGSGNSLGFRCALIDSENP